MLRWQVHVLGFKSTGTPQTIHSQLSILHLLRGAYVLANQPFIKMHTANINMHAYDSPQRQLPKCTARHAAAQRQHVCMFYHCSHPILQSASHTICAATASHLQTTCQAVVNTSRPPKPCHRPHCLFSSLLEINGLPLPQMTQGETQSHVVHV